MVKIVYKCPLAKLPGGLRLVQKAAKRAGFNGTIVLKCAGEDRDSRAEMKDNRFLAGKFFSPDTILLYRNTSHYTHFHKAKGFAKVQKAPREAYRTLLHELGHFRRAQNGRLLSAYEYALDPSPEERSADRYANKEIEVLWPTKVS